MALAVLLIESHAHIERPGLVMLQVNWFKTLFYDELVMST